MFNGLASSGRRLRGSSLVTPNRRRTVLGALFGLSAALTVFASGCTRQYYRRDADQEAYALIAEKESDPRWDIPDQSVYPDPRSRYYDPYDPDREPIPPDDPASHELMHCVYGKKGYRRWHKNGDLPELENPDWRQHLGKTMDVDDEGRYRMDLPDAVELALIHSRTYQSNVENLYLSALDVAFERFRFDAQFFAGNRTTWAHRGSEPTQNSSSTLTTANTARASKLLPSGGQFMADFANTFMWQFAGPDSNTRADSLLSFTFLQPLLRQGGREVALETLTRAERGLLANVRQMERYRQGFFSDLALGTGAGQGPQRRGGFLGGAGLSDFTGTGSGGFGGVGQATQFGRFGGVGGGGGAAGGGGGGGFAGGVAGNVGGFIGLAQQAQQLRNQKANLDLQFENLARYEELFAAGRIESIQLDQFRQNFQTARSQYLAAVDQYRRAVEAFLVTLGLPPDLPVQIDESVVEPFRFSDPTLSELRRQVNLLTERVRTAEDPALEDVRKWLDELQAFRDPVAQRFDAVREDFKRLDLAQPQRLEALTQEDARKAFLEQVERLKRDFASLETQFATILGRTKKVQDVLKTEPAKTAQQELAAALDALSTLLLELVFNQAGVRLEAVVLPPVRLSTEVAFRIALANRLDIMNQRAEVVDQWRLIAFNADRLEADLNIELNGSIGTLDRNIVKFRDQTGSFTAGVRLDTPITRLAERNFYRESLINYQGVRRDYIQFEDGVKQSLNNTLKSVKLLDEEMELRREAMRIAVRQMDLNQARLKEPPRAGAAQVGDPVRDLLQAFTDFLTTQNGVMNTYLTYQSLRITLYRDLGIIQFDPRGIWIDEPLDVAIQRAETGERVLPPAITPGYPNVPADRIEQNSQPTGILQVGGELQPADPEAGTVVDAASGDANRPVAGRDERPTERACSHEKHSLRCRLRAALEKH